MTIQIKITVERDDNEIDLDVFGSVTREDVTIDRIVMDGEDWDGELTDEEADEAEVDLSAAAWDGLEDDELALWLDER